MLFLIFASSFVRTSVLITQFLNLFAAYLSNEYETKYFLTGQKSLSVETSRFFFCTPEFGVQTSCSSSSIVEAYAD